MELDLNLDSSIFWTIPSFVQTKGGLTVVPIKLTPAAVIGFQAMPLTTTTKDGETKEIMASRILISTGLVVESPILFSEIEAVFMNAIIKLENRMRLVGAGR